MVRTIAVIGGGVSGLACARRLKELGLEPTVFDTGKRTVGGRASSRLWRGMAVDHAAQLITTTSLEFAAHMNELVTLGAVRLVPNSELRTIIEPGRATPLNDGVARYSGVGGIQSFVRAASAGLDIRQDVWVSPNGGIHATADSAWLIRESRTVESRFDCVVVAHNGKCAERLTSAIPAIEVHSLLRAKFSAQLGQGSAVGGGNGKMTLNSIYSLLLEVEAGVMPEALGTAAYVQCEPALQFLSNNTAKLGKPGDAGVGSAGVGGADARDGARGGAKGVKSATGVEVWTVISSASFGSEHKAPQEHIEGSEVSMCRAEHVSRDQRRAFRGEELVGS